MNTKGFYRFINIFRFAAKLYPFPQYIGFGCAAERCPNSCIVCINCRYRLIYK